MDGQRNNSKWLQYLSRYQHGRSVCLETDRVTGDVNSVYGFWTAIRPDLLLRSHSCGFERGRKCVLEPGDGFNSIDRSELEEREEQYRTTSVTAETKAKAVLADSLIPLSQVCTPGQ
jgi:hypothetical protein